MKLSLQERFSSVAVVVALAAVLIVLGVMQYHWSRAVSDATTMRMKASLHSSLLNWRQDFYRELGQAADPLQFPAAADSKSTLAEAARRYREANRVAAHPQLVKDVYAYSRAGTTLSLLNKTSGDFGPAQWPEGFQQLRDWLERSDQEFAIAGAHIRHMNEPGMPAMVFSTERGHMHGPGPMCRIAQDVPALVCLVMGPVRGAVPPRVAQFFIVQLDPVILREHVFPELAERHFAGAATAYQVAVVTLGREHRVIYASDPSFTGQDTAGAEFAINIFGPPMAAFMARDGVLVAPPISSSETHSRRQLHAGVNFAFMRFDPIHYDGPPADWQVVVGSRGGSLEAVAAAIRRRNLAISFGVLLVLAATMGVILVSARRAQRLARLQMDFVAGVSHELRTPLTVISSAADNIADGVVDSQQQVIRYGKVIQTQARQLIHLVEQVLLFAANGNGLRHHTRLLAVEDVVSAALESTAELIAAAGFTVEKQIEHDLPPVAGDLVALSQCLQNLITNAVKYGGESRWMAVRGSRANGDGRDEIQIAVSDKGAGIAPEDLEHIFEPFYRGASVTAAQIHGTGLGLPLARSIAEAMNGRLTVASQPGEGSTFVLHLPVAGDAASRPEAPQAEAAKVS